MRSNSRASSSKCFLIVSMAVVNASRDRGLPHAVGPRISILYCINPHLSTLARTSRDSQEKAVHALSLPSKISGCASAQRGGNLGEELVVVRIFHLKDEDEALSSRHVNAFVLGIVVKIIRIRDAGQ